MDGLASSDGMQHPVIQSNAFVLGIPKRFARIPSILHELPFDFKPQIAVAHLYVGDSRQTADVCRHNERPSAEERRDGSREIRSSGRLPEISNLDAPPEFPREPLPSKEWMPPAVPRYPSKEPRGAAW